MTKSDNEKRITLSKEECLVVKASIATFLSYSFQPSALAVAERLLLRLVEEMKDDR